MKAAFKDDKMQVTLRDVPERPLKADEVRIAVEACGVCGTDLHPGPPEGEIFGHEVAGRVVETGAAAGRFAKGQRVVFESSTACGRCDNCRDARQEFCTQVLSFNQAGNTGLGFAETMIAPMASVIPYEGLTPEVACLQEPLGVAIDMLRMAELDLHSRVLLVGPGPIGLMALEIARNSGVKHCFVAGRKARPGRYECAKRIGFEAWIEPEELATFDFGKPIDRVLVTAPPPAIPSAVAAAGPGAIVSYIGIGWKPDLSRQTLDLDAMHFKKQQLRPSYACPALFGPRALTLLREKTVDGERYLSHRFPLARVAEAFATARRDPTAVKVVVGAY